MEHISNTMECEAVQSHSGLNITAHVARVTNNNKNSFLCHKQVGILLVLDGSFKVCCGNIEYRLNKNDIFIVNASELHYISKINFGGSGDILVVYVPTFLFNSYYGEISQMRFTDCLIRCDRQDASLYSKLWDHIIRLALTLHHKEKGYELDCMSYINSFFSISVKYNNLKMVDTNHEDCDGSVNSKRIERIVNMINENFVNNITLTEIAEKESLDIYYLSHFIKKYLGVSFRQYINKLKLAKAVEYLCHTNKKMIDICMESGYSDYRYFYKAFTDRYQCKPSHFREMFQKNLREEKTSGIYEDKETGLVLMDEEQSFARIEKYAKSMRRSYAQQPCIKAAGTEQKYCYSYLY